MFALAALGRACLAPAAWRAASAGAGRHAAPALRAGAAAPAGAAACGAGGARRGMAVHAGTFKTPSSVKKRFRVTAGGSIVRRKGGKSHLNAHKSSARVARLGRSVVLTGGIRARYLRALQVSALAAR